MKSKKEKVHNHCIQCGKVIETRCKYCSVQCQLLFQYQQCILRWKQGLESGINGEYGLSRYIKRYLIDKFDNKCSKCGWCKINPFTGKVPLEVHHKDGDYKNNTEDNLDLLCPNCHSLTNTYKASNTGNGRRQRKKYNQ